MVDFDFIADVFFHAHPVEEEFHEGLNIFLAEKFVILVGISIVEFGSIVDDEIVYVVDDIPDGLLFEFIEGIIVWIVWFSPVFVLVFDVLNALVDVFGFLRYLLIIFFCFGDFMVVLVYDLILFIILIIVLFFFDNFFLVIILFQVILILRILVIVLDVLAIPVLLLVSSLFDVLR